MMARLTIIRSIPRRLKRKAKIYMNPDRFTVDALVIREQQVGESDKLITLLSRNNGVIKAYASGAKSIKSKKGAATSLLAYSSVTLTQKGDTYRVTEASPIQIFFNAGDDIEALSLAQYFCELCIYHAPNSENCESVLRLILNSLHFLSNKSRDIFILKSIFEMRLMALTGYLPNLVACDGCAKYEDDIMYFDTNEGKLYCRKCHEYNSECAVVNMTLPTALRHIGYSDLSKLFMFSIPTDAARGLSMITERYLLNKTEQKLKTLSFFNSLFKEF